MNHKLMAIAERVKLVHGYNIANEIADIARDDGWIKVCDRLPYTDDSIIMCNEHGDRFSGKGGVLIATNNSDDPFTGRRSRYTHWQLMPNPPKDSI